MKTRSIEQLTSILRDKNPRRDGWYEARDYFYSFVENSLNLKRVHTGQGSSFKFTNKNSLILELSLDDVLSM